VDIRNFRIPGKQKLECELTLRDGSVVWDLNGLTAVEFKKARGSN
jgi:dihydroorotase